MGLKDLPIILVAEDDHSIQSIVEQALTEGGFETAIAASGEEVVTLMQGNRTGYSALVIEIKLRGGMDGWATARAVRKINPAFPVIYMTGGAAGEWPFMGVPESVLLQKPFATAQLVTALSQLVNRSGLPSAPP